MVSNSELVTVIGASLSEPHTSELVDAMSEYVRTYVRMHVVRSGTFAYS